MIFLKNDSISSICLGIAIPLYIVKVMFLLQIPYFITLNRITYNQVFDATVFGSEIADAVAIVILSSTILFFGLQKITYKIIFPILASVIILFSLIEDNVQLLNILSISSLPFSTAVLLIRGKIVDGNYFSKIFSKKIIFGSFITLVFFESASLLSWILYPVLQSKFFLGYEWHFAKLEAEVFQVLGLSSPHLILLIVFSFVLLAALKNFSKEIRSILNRFKLQYLLDDITGADSSLRFQKTNLSKGQILLVLSLVLSVVFSIYPYLPSINPDMAPIGTDIIRYRDWINQSIDQDFGKTVEKVFLVINFGNRPLSILFLLSVTSITSFFNITMIDALKFVPLILSPALSLAVYYFVKIGTNNKLIAGFSALLTIVSYHFTVGMYAAFYSNWLALVSSYLTLMLVLKFWKNPTKSTYVLLFALTIITLFIHSFTWTFLIASLGAFVLISYFQKNDKKIKFLVLTMILLIGTNVAIDLFKTIPFGNPTSFEQDFTIPNIAPSISEFALRWNNLESVFRIYLGGFLSNTILLALTLAWILTTNYKKAFNRILLASFFVGALPTLFGTFVVQSRIFYDMSLHIPVAILLYQLSTQHNSRVGKVIVVAVLLHFFNYVFRSLANFYFIPPG